MNLKAKPRMRIRENVTYKVTDSAGKIKKLFQHNKLGAMVGNIFRVVPKFALFGAWQDSMTVSNLVTNAGVAAVAGIIGEVGAVDPFEYIAVGTGTTAAGATDTALVTEITDSGLARVQASASLITTDVTNDTLKLTTTFTVSGTKAVTESGVFNAASSGTMIARQVFSAVNVASGDNLQVDWSFDVD